MQQQLLEAEEDLPDDEEREELKEIYSRITFIASKVVEYANEMAVLLETLKEQNKRKRTSKERDKNGKPTWRFAVKVLIPQDIFLTQAFTEYYLGQGLPEADLQDTFSAFVNWYNRKQTKWGDWSRVWFDWCRRERKRRQATPEPVVPARTSRSLPEF